MGVSVKLYVYDLSNGLARQLSRQLTGRQIDGIWHTSVVVHGKEVFYGQGISITSPGGSHHGSPMQVIDLGETNIDADTFNDYIQDMRGHYTADKYHLLDFNCNSFTNDMVGFLTGGSIPAYIKDLPSDFLSTPFGAALRPQIDAMYTGRQPAQPDYGQATPAAQSQIASSLLQSVAAQAQSNGASPRPSQSHTEALTSPLHPCTNPASFHSLLAKHRAVVAYFTSAGCPPCRIIEPIFERLAEEKGIPSNSGSAKKGAAFTKIDMGIGMGQSVASEYGVRVTPTFLFFLDGQLTSDLKGADANELRTQIDLLLFQAYPPHPHTSLSLPSIEALSLNPILFSQVPQLDVVIGKLASNISSGDSQLKLSATNMASWLKTRFSSSTVNGKTSQTPSAQPSDVNSWVKAATSLANMLPIESLFPLVDMWRLAILDNSVASWISSKPQGTPGPLDIFMYKYTQNQHAPNRAFTLCMLRMLSNAFAHQSLAQLLLSIKRDSVTKILVSSLLSEDTAVRTAASSLAFNCTATIQQTRVNEVRDRGGYSRNGNQMRVNADNEQDEDWHVEILSALVEVLTKEANEDVVHRLSASLACLLRLSPFYETGLGPLLEVLQTKTILEEKATGFKKAEVQKLAKEVVKLCPTPA